MRYFAPVVQMDRTVDSGSAGCAFESRRARPNSAYIFDVVAELRILVRVQRRTGNRCVWLQN
jgi:hypothetical protein